MRPSITRKPAFHRTQTRSERQVIPQARPMKKLGSRRVAHKPYTELGRFSIFDIIQVTKKIATRGMDSARTPTLNGISFAAAPGSGARCVSVARAVAPLRREAIRATKMTRLQPARGPSGPMKILCRREG